MGGSASRPLINGIILSILCVGMAGYALKELSFNLTCLEATATVLNVEKTVSRSRVSYRVTYIFRLDGKSYQSHDSLKSRPAGETLPVYYSPNNPKDSKLKKANIPLLVLLALVSGGAGAYQLVSYSRQKRAG